MGWPMIKSMKPVYGIAKVKAQKDGGIKFQLKDEDKIWTIESKNVPDEYKTMSGVFAITVSEDKSKLFRMYPHQGSFKCKFVGFVAQEGKDPEPRVKTGKFGTYQTAIASLKIIDGIYTGMIIPYILSFNLEDMDGITAIKGGGKAAKKFADFLDAIGCWEEVIPFSENILPTIQKRALKANKTVLVMVKEGWVDSAVREDAPNFGDLEDEDEEDTLEELD